VKDLGIYDVIVVGGGPIGCVAARSAARRGAHVLLLEKAETPTYPDRCTGIISPRCLEQAEVGDDVVLRTITGGIVYAPNGRSLQVEAPAPRALVIDRRLFHSRLTQSALQAGVEYLSLSRVVHLDGPTITVHRDEAAWTARGDVIIGADGPRSMVARQMGLPPPERLFLGLQATARFIPDRDDFVSIYIDQDLAPGFFAWMVPAEPGMVRVGLATNRMRGAHSLLKAFLGKLNLTPIKVNTGLIPLGARPKTVMENVMLVGDAAAQAKPSSGGGLFTGLLAAHTAGRVAAERSDSLGALEEYEAAWRKDLQRELSLGMAMRRLYAHLSNHEINLIFALLDNKPLLDIMSTYGDIDYPSNAIRALLKEPRLWTQVLTGLPLQIRTIMDSVRMQATNSDTL